MKHPTLTTLTLASSVAALSCALLVPNGNAALADYDAILATNFNQIFIFQFEGSDDSARLADSSFNGYVLQRVAGSMGGNTNDIQFVSGFDGVSQAYQPSFSLSDYRIGAGLNTSFSVTYGSAVTVEAIVQLDGYTQPANSTSGSYILSARNSSAERAYFLRQRETNEVVTTLGDTFGDALATLDPYTAGDWYYVALTADFDGSVTTVNLYRANLSTNQTTIEHVLTDNTTFTGNWSGLSEFGVGAFLDGTAQYMQGRLDNVALTGEVLASNDFQTRLEALYIPSPCVTAGVGADPDDQTVELGNTASFTVAATGKLPTYQWQLSTNSGATWNNITVGGTDATYTTPVTTTNDSGNLYRSIISVACDSSSVPSAAATLTVTLPEFTVWTNSPGGEWNEFASWDYGIPDETIDGLIPAGNAVTYDSPMAADNILGATMGGSLAVNTSGFNIDAQGQGPVLSVLDGGSMTIGASGVVTISNAPAFRMMDRNSRMSVDGGSLVFTDNLGAITIGENGNVSATYFTNNLGSVTVDQSFQLRGRYTGFYMTGGTLDLLGGGGVYESSNDQERRFEIDGGVANLGDFSISRTTSGGGLLVNDGVVTATSLRIGTAASRAYGDVYGGTLTVSGDFSICDRNNGATSGDRRIRFFIRGGEVTSTSTNGIVVANQSNTGAAGYSTIGGLLEVRDNGTLNAEMITLVGSTNLLNAHARLNLTGNGLINLGGGGLVGNVGETNTSYAAELNGGTLAATTDLTIAADLTPGGGALQAADSLATPHDITITGGLVGSGTLVKTGAGSLILQGTSTHSGDINVNEGTLGLQGDGIDSTLNIDLAAGTTFDVGSGYTLNNAQTLKGEGTVSNDVSAASGSTITVADLTTIGTLTFTDDLTESGGVVNQFDVSSGSQDLLVVQKALNLSGLNTVQVNIVGSVPGGAYLLIDYGTISGGVGNLELAGATGSLSNNTTQGAIYLVLDVERPATNLTWVGDSVLNLWDTGTSTNWISGGMPFTFLPSDDVGFGDAGSTTPPVQLAGDLVPASVVVDASVDYTFDGAGKITGLTGLTKTNSGKLTVLATNDYVGVTTIAGGTLSVSNLADGGLASPIGAASADAANVVLNGGSLEYLGGSLTWDRGITLGANGGGLNIAAATVTTVGSLTGEGTITKQGDGTWHIDTANNYGGTIIEAGVIRELNNEGLGTNSFTFNGTASTATYRFVSSDQWLDNDVYVYGTSNMLINSGNNYISDMFGDGTLLVDFGSGNYLSPRDSDMTAFSGKMVLGDAGMNLRFYSGSYGGSLFTLDMGNGASRVGPRTGANDRIVRLGALMGGVSSLVSGPFSGSGATEYEIGGNSLSTTFDGTIQNSSGVVSLTKVGSGTLTLSGSSTYTGDTTVSGGTLALTDFATLSATPNISVETGATLDVSALSTPILYLNTGQTLSGNGTVNGSIDTSGGGTVSPGASIGTLTVTGDAGLWNTTVMEINRGAVPNADKVVAPTIQLAGTVVVSNIGGNLQVGDTFDLLDGAITDFGHSVQLPVGYGFDTTQLGVDGTISVTSAPVPPQITSTSLQSGTNLVVSGTGGTAFATYLVLASTEVDAPVITWIPVQTNTFAGDGSFIFTNVVNPNEPTEFFIIQE